MPTSRYNRYFGGNAAKALAEMKKRYGAAKGRRIFYATANKRRRDHSGRGR
jgi:hypothetical protein